MNAAQTANSGAANTPAPDPHKDYFEQIFPAPPVVCGRQLKPLSIDRYRLMRRFNVAFVSDAEAEATARDLLFAVLICSMDREEFIELVSSPKVEKKLHKWGRRFGFLPPRYFSFPLIGKLLYRLAGKAVDQADAEYLTSQISLFNSYIKENSKSPRYWEESNNTTTSAAHWSHSIEAVLRGQLNWTADEVRNEPLNKAIWDFYKHMEQQGCVRLMTADEIVEADTDYTPEEKEKLLAWAEAIKKASKN